MTFTLLLFALCAAALNMAIGSVWYMPGTFGKMWMKDAKVNPNSSKSSPAKPLVVGFVSYVLVALIVGRIRMMYAGGLVEFLIIIAMLWVAFTFCIKLTHAMFEQKPLRYVAVTAGHDLVSLLATATVMYHA